jgi:hypothetical protein
VFPLAHPCELKTLYSPLITQEHRDDISLNRQDIPSYLSKINDLQI